MPQTYANHNLHQLWQILAAEDPETGFTHVNTLNRLRAALEQQRDNLRSQRDHLSEAWPPDRSEAAAAFVAQLNEMIDAITYTATAAARICTGVDATFAAIRDARRRLEALKADYPHRGTGQGLVVAQPSDPDLDRRAREVMIATDTKIATAAKSYSTPLPRYQRVIEPGVEIVESGEGPTGSAVGRSTGGGSHSLLLQPPVFDPPSGGGGTDTRTRDDNPGPVPAGELPARANTPAGGGGTGPLPSFGPMGVIGGDVRSGGPAPVPGSVVGLRPGVVGPDGVIGGTRPSAPPAGQILGGPMSGIAAQPGATRAGRNRRSGRPEPPAESTTPGRVAGGYQDRSYEEYAQRRRSRRSEDDELWPVEEGVAPVLDAVPEHRHDPGPGVLGIDR
jgi:hypothetical protein